MKNLKNIGKMKSWKMKIGMIALALLTTHHTSAVLNAVALAGIFNRESRSVSFVAGLMCVVRLNMAKRGVFDLEEEIEAVTETIGKKFTEANTLQLRNLRNLIESWNSFVDSYVEIRDEIDSEIADEMDDLIGELAKRIKEMVKQN